MFFLFNRHVVFAGGASWKSLFGKPPIPKRGAGKLWESVVFQLSCLGFLWLYNKSVLAIWQQNHKSVKHLSGNFNNVLTGTLSYFCESVSLHYEVRRGALCCYMHPVDVTQWLGLKTFWQNGRLEIFYQFLFQWNISILLECNFDHSSAENVSISINDLNTTHHAIWQWRPGGTKTADGATM